MTDPEQIREIERRIRSQCADDLCGLWNIIWHLERLEPRPSEAEIREVTLDMVHRNLDADLIAPTTNPYLGTHEGAGKSTEEIMRLYHEGWDQLGRLPTIGDLIYFTAPRTPATTPPSARQPSEPGYRRGVRARCSGRSRCRMASGPSRR